MSRRAALVMTKSRCLGREATLQGLLAVPRKGAVGMGLGRELHAAVGGQGRAQAR